MKTRKNSLIRRLEFYSMSQYLLMLQFYYFTEPRFERHIGKHLQSTDRIQKHSNMRLAQYNCARDRSCTFIQDETCQGTNVWTMKSRRMHDRTSGGYCVWAKGIMYPTFESFISPLHKHLVCSNIMNVKPYIYFFRIKKTICFLQRFDRNKQ